MHPSKLIPLLAILMLIGVSVGVWAIYTGLKDQPRVIETIVATQAIVSFAETSSATPSPLPSRTPDYGDLPVTQTAVRVLEIANTAEAGVVAIDQTQSALDTANGRLTATQKVADATATLTARSLQTQADLEKASRERQLERQRAQDRLELILAYTWQIGGSILLILGTALWMIVAFKKYTLNATRKAAEKISANFLENIQVPVVQTSTDAHSGAEHEVAISGAEFLVLRQAVIDLKGILSRRRVIEGKYFTGTRWRELDDELLRQDAYGTAFFEMLPSGALTPTEAGWKWLNLTPPAPPQAPKSVENLENAASAQPDPAQPTTTQTDDPLNLK